MDHFKKDITYFLILMIFLFCAWVATGGPESARKTGSDQDRFQQPIAPINSGQTYDKPIKEILPIKIQINPQSSY
jgi:hypothetical protein